MMLSTGLSKTIAKSLCLAAAGMIAFATLTVPLRAQEDFSGNNLEIIIPFAEGGGADSYARFLAQFVKKHLPGSPAIVPRNVPGGGSITGANYFQAHAKDDGLMAMAMTPSPLLSYLLNPEDKRIQYDPRGWIPVIGAVSGRVIYVHKDAGLKSASQIKGLNGKVLNMGLETPTGSDLASLLSLDLLGINVHAVFGFAGGGPIRLAFERGEFQINWEATQNFMSSAKPMVESGTAIPLFSFGILDDKGGFIRDPNFPDIPHFVEVYREVHGKDPSGPGFEAWKALFQASVMSSRAMVLPASTRPAVVKTYETAMANLLKDAEFLAQSAKFLGDYPQLQGEQALQNIRQATTISDEARTWLRNWLTTKYSVKF